MISVYRSSERSVSFEPRAGRVSPRQQSGSPARAKRAARLLPPHRGGTVSNVKMGRNVRQFITKTIRLSSGPTDAVFSQNWPVLTKNAPYNRVPGILS